jgi:P-type conjugative transfer protein TrbJ
MNKPVLALVASLLFVAAAPAAAQRIVFDPSNYSQNILTAARTLEQINNQIRQLQNDARNLTSLDFSALPQMRATTQAVNQLIQQAQGIAFNLSQMDAEFARLHPQTYAATISGNQMAIDARTRWRNSLEALRTAVQVQSQAVQNLPRDEQNLADLVERSQAAVGALQALQATNQLLALQSRQAMQAQQLQITQERAASLELARQVAVQERAREVRRRFLGEGSRYTPQPVDFYNQ